MKKLASLTLCLLLALGCAGGALAEDVTISYISSTILESPEGAFEQDLIDRFNAMDNGITVEVQGVASNDLNTKMVALAAADDLPAFVMGNETLMGALLDMEVVAPVQDIFEKEYLDGFVAANIDSFTVDGVRVGIPYFGGAQGVVYRKDIFEEKGVAVPTTWEELVDAAKKLTVDGNYGITLVGTRNSSGASRFQPVVRNFGCDEFYKDEAGKWQTDIGSEKYIQALRAFTDLVTVHEAVPPGVVETGYPEAVALFSSGKAAMLITGSNALGAITAQVPDLVGKIGSFPNIKVERQVSTAAGFGLFITTQDEAKQKAAAEFIKFMHQPENALAFAGLTGRLPVRQECFDDPSIQNISGLEGFIQALENVYIPPTIPGYSEVEDIHAEAYQTVFTGQGTVEDAAAKALTRAQAICDAANGE